MKKMMKKAVENFTKSCDTIYNKNRGTLLKVSQDLL